MMRLARRIVLPLGLLAALGGCYAYPYDGYYASGYPAYYAGGYYPAYVGTGVVVGGWGWGWGGWHPGWGYRYGYGWRGGWGGWRGGYGWRGGAWRGRPGPSGFSGNPAHFHH